MLPAASPGDLLVYDHLATLLIVSGVRTAPAGVAAFGAAGLICAAILPLTISLGGKEFSRAREVVSGELIAFYQVGYGLAAFGVGPLQDAAGVPLSAVYAWASMIAAGMTVLAFLIVRPPAGVASAGHANPGRPLNTHVSVPGCLL